MKKYLAGMVVAAAALVASASPSWAFQSVKITTVTASVTTSGSKQASFTTTIRNVATPLTGSATAITWSGVDPLSTTWKIADQLIVINSTVTDSAGGIRIYTDNTAADATPKFVDPTPADADDADSKVNSLLKGTSGTTSEAGLPMAWTIKTTTVTVGSTLQPREPNDSVLLNQTGPGNPYQWLYMTDKSNWDGIDLNNDGDYVDAGESAPLGSPTDPFTVMINKSGSHFGQAPTEFDTTPDGSNMYVYFQANFNGADVQQAYQTTALRIEAFIQ